MKKFIKKGSKKLDNRSYYDKFAENYENERGVGYHKMVDDFEIEITSKYLKKWQKVVEVGCGTGLILDRVKNLVKIAKGVDISPEMLSLAKKRGLDVVEGDITSLPFKDDQFDLLYSFKVLAHVEDIEKGLKEMERVVKPNGYLILEFYNKFSLRGLIKFLKSPTKIADGVDDEKVYTRYDSLKSLKKIFPDSFIIKKIEGIRVVTPAYFVHKVPIIKNIFYKVEKKLKSTYFGRFGGFLVLVIKNEKE